MQAPTPRLFLAFLALAMVTLVMLFARAAHAGWQEEATRFDRARLDHIEQSRAQGLAEADKGGGIGDAQAIRETLLPAGHSVDADALQGEWRCRQMKLGGMTPFIVYDWFHCSIRRINGELFFRKLDGTQRTEGFLYSENGAWVYLGASSEADEPPHRYSGNQASIGAVTTPDDQIGLLTAIGAHRLRLELPAPAQESDFDAIELER